VEAAFQRPRALEAVSAGDAGPTIYILSDGLMRWTILVLRVAAPFQRLTDSHTRRPVLA
jgi:hypothetical protein